MIKSPAIKLDGLFIQRAELGNEEIKMDQSLIGHCKKIKGLLQCSLVVSLVALITRLTLGGIFWNSGRTKLPFGSDTTVALFQDEYLKKVGELFFGGTAPEWAAIGGAYLSTTFELGCALLLVAGLFSRFATLPLIGISLFIQLLVYPDFWKDHMAWISMLLWILIMGPGKFSVDHLIFGRAFSEDKMKM